MNIALLRFRGTAVAAAVVTAVLAASCERGGASWLEVHDLASKQDTRPRVTELLGPAWGYHLDDINLALGNLVSDVRGEERAYQSQS